MLLPPSELIIVTCLPNVETCSAVISLEAPDEVSIKHFEIAPASSIISSVILPWIEPLFVITFVPIILILSTNNGSNSLASFNCKISLLLFIIIASSPIALTARYIKTAETITPGVVSAVATITLSYQ